MLDINLLRRDLPAVTTGLARRGITFDADRFATLEEQRKALQVETEALQSRRNTLAKQIGQLRSKGEDATALMAESRQIPEQLATLENQLSAIQQTLNDWLATLPNLPHDSVPEGQDESANVEVRRWLPGKADASGDPAALPFTPQDHVAVGEPLGLDFETARKLSGSRFVMLRGGMARLHRALAHFMLDVQTQEHGYQECYTPYIVTADTLFGTGQLPKFKDDMFWVTKGGDEDTAPSEPAAADDTEQQDTDATNKELFLISTSEITLTGSAKDSILSRQELPVRLTAHTPCFRSEAGSGGRDVRGMIRQHQFDKVEMVQLVHPEESYAALEAMVGHAETILQRLELPYRVVTLCSGDMGF
ncbi:MAG TPA: serine--tRNA ligase, partial [Burkholderiaceae bacterium]|nr:serine--tRNA ligase [Burkholderiaceae bacterium]